LFSMAGGFEKIVASAGGRQAGNECVLGCCSN
jgi:hypothetical protein